MTANTLALSGDTRTRIVAAAVALFAERGYVTELVRSAQRGGAFAAVASVDGQTA